MHLVLCDDHPIVMHSMAVMFRAHGHEVAATATRPEQLRDLVLQHRPHVCVTDLLFDGEGPDTAFAAIGEVSPFVDVVVLSGAPGLAARALAAGATAVGSKALPATDIVALVEGRTAEGAVTRPVDRARTPYLLTDREVQVLQSLSDGDSTARMAERLGVRHATARSHVQSVLLKLGVHSRVAAVAVAVEAGVVQVPA
ncbi:MAG TPA: response regulator transcription factor [Iamia sp.]|nr:response regulator transcription factor [Iamia sp.]